MARGRNGKLHAVLIALRYAEVKRPSRVGPVFPAGPLATGRAMGKLV
jgi:hypothetical protein